MKNLYKFVIGFLLLLNVVGLIFILFVNNVSFTSNLIYKFDQTKFSFFLVEGNLEIVNQDSTAIQFLIDSTLNGTVDSILNNWIILKSEGATKMLLPKECNYLVLALKYDLKSIQNVYCE